MSAGDQAIDTETLLFFKKQPAALPIYKAKQQSTTSIEAAAPLWFKSIAPQ